MGMDFVSDDGLDAQDVRQVVEREGISGRAADVLVQVILEPDFLGRAIGRQRDCGDDLDFVRRFVGGATECFRFQNPDASLLDLLMVLSGYRDAEWWTALISPNRVGKWNEAALGFLARASWTAKLLACINSLAPALVEAWTPDNSKKAIEFAAVLSDRVGVERLNISDAIDVRITLQAMRETEGNVTPSPATPLFWYLAFNQRGILNPEGREPPSNKLTRQMLNLADSSTDDDMATLYRSVIRALIVCTHRSPIQDPMANVILAFFTGGNHLPILSTRKIVLEHYPHLTSRAQNSNASSALVTTWLMTGMWVATRFPTSPLLASGTSVSEGTLTIDSPGALGEIAEALLSKADLVVGNARKTLREGHPIDWPAVEYSVKLLNWLGSPWRALRAVTQLLMLAPAPCTDADLRWWSEDGLPDPPTPWVQLAQWFSWLILWSDVHAEQDPEFKRGREDFSQFLLDRLKDRSETEKPAEQKGTRVPIESRPEWRVAICEAAIVLHANPKGRGDHVLYQVMNHDPDEMVRKAAEKAYNKVRYYKGDTGGRTARSLFMKSFWWLRQAQRLSLGLDINQAGAQRTMNKEIDRNAVNQWV